MATYQQVRRLAKKAPQGYGRTFESVASEQLSDEYRFQQPARVWHGIGSILNYGRLYMRVKAGLYQGYEMFEDEWSVLAFCPNPASWEYKYGKHNMLRLLAYIEKRAARHGFDLPE